MTTINDEFISFAEKEVSDCILRLTCNISQNQVELLAKEIVKRIDWENLALMHKGLSWMTKNYLVKQGMI